MGPTEVGTFFVINSWKTYVYNPDKSSSPHFLLRPYRLNFSYRAETVTDTLGTGEWVGGDSESQGQVVYTPNLLCVCFFGPRNPCESFLIIPAPTVRVPQDRGHVGWDPKGERDDV